MTETTKQCKEKLINLIVEGNIMAFGRPESFAEIIADNLIANGVTIPEWTPVSEGLPNNHAEAYHDEWGEDPEYLVMIDRGQLPTTLYYDRENEMWYRINSALKREVYQVTHWMHLPEPVKRD